jgi:lipoate-protein ligase A
MNLVTYLRLINTRNIHLSSGRKWRLIDSGYCDAYSNMALDEALLLAGIEEHSPPCLRLYGWKPAAVSIGYAQDITRGVNFPACQRRGLMLVRRPTGGRGVFHQQELTYSVTAPESFFPNTGLIATYREISRALIAGLYNLGIRSDPAIPKNGQSIEARNKSSACFMSSSWYEITVKGKKLIGSAQRRLKSHILQQGSILLAVDHMTITDLFANGDTQVAERVQQARQRITSLAELLEPPVKIEQLKQAVLQGFRQGLDIEFIKSDLSAYERTLAHRLYTHKYSTSIWNFERGEVR